ncbi:hypothetical protein AB6A40_007718 [Gnathostoma spinigerum]|uniref:DUF4139 domain-containing protein n=1 Tax=Gnathostoma spinigerum TaxID=75299 RepID=A0ABD6ES65_9BILA
MILNKEKFRFNMEERHLHHLSASDVPISAVTVFNDRAEVTRRDIAVQLQSGMNEVILENVSKQIIPASIRVEGHGVALIHEVQLATTKMSSNETRPPRIKALDDELKKLEDEFYILQDKERVLWQKVETLDKITEQIGRAALKSSHDKPFSFSDDAINGVSKFFAFYEKNSLETRTRHRDASKQTKDVEEKLNKVKGEIDAFERGDKSCRNISVILEHKGAESERTVLLTISYQVTCASWFPTYDIRVQSDKENEHNMKLSYFGTIRQNTGEDWNNVNVVLSTAIPALGGHIPKLGTLQAEFKKVVPPSIKAAPYAAKRPMMALCATSESFMYDEMEVEPMVAEAKRDTLSTTFNIERPNTIPSDNSEHRITIAVLSFELFLLHETVPVKNPTAFLTAIVRNNSSYPLLRGRASIYFNNSFVCQSIIKAVSPNERFICSLGRDAEVKVTYKPLSQFTEQSGLIAKSLCRVHDQRIVIKNNKASDILLTVKEQIPKSTNEKMKIKLFSPEIIENVKISEKKPHDVLELPKIGAVLNEDHNLEWTLNLKSGEEKELVVKWCIEYPSTETIEFHEEFSRRTVC